MTPEAQRIAIAEACGWTVHHGGKYVAIPGSVGWGMSALVDPLRDLNAMHEAEKVLIEKQRYPKNDYETGCWTRYVHILRDVEVKFYGSDIHSTAAQRAEAFLRTLGKWTETDASHLSKVESNTAQH